MASCDRFLALKKVGSNHQKTTLISSSAMSIGESRKPTFASGLVLTLAAVVRLTLASVVMLLSHVRLVLGGSGAWRRRAAPLA